MQPIALWEWEQTGTAPDGKFVGEYIKRNEISDDLMRARRLDQVERFTVEDVYRMSELPPDMKKGL